jgi:MFS family permease
MSTVLIVIFYIVQITLSLIVMYWLSQRYEGRRFVLVVSALVVAVSLVLLALFFFFFYAAAVLIIVLMARWLMAEWEHPKYGGIILGLYFGFFLSFPVGVYQYAN